MKYNDSKYLFKINNLLNFMIIEIQKQFNSNEFEILFLRLNDITIKEISKKTNKNENEIKKILSKILHRRKFNKLITINTIILINLIENSFTFKKRFLENIPPFSFKWIKFFCKKHFIFFKNSLYEKENFNHILKIMKNKEMNISSGYFASLFSNKKFIENYCKGYSNKNYYFHTKDIFFKWFIKNYKIINSKKDFEYISKILKITIKRNLTVILERKKYLLKINSKSFIFFYDELIQKSHILYEKTKFLVENKNIYAFEEIYAWLKKDVSIKFELSFFPEDSLYYFLKRKYLENFNFDTGRMMVIYPKYKKIFSLKDNLEKMFPNGYGLVKKEIIQKMGFSKHFKINSGNLIWGKNIYLNLKKQKEVISDFQKYFQKNNLINYIEDIYKNSSKPTKLYIDNSFIYSKMGNYFKKYELLFNVFINLNLKEIKKIEKNKIIEFLGDKVVNITGTKDFLYLVFFQKKPKNYRNRKIEKILKNYNLLKPFMKYIYSKFQISPENKKLIREKIILL